jgi:hypothetical protein
MWMTFGDCFSSADLNRLMGANLFFGREMEMAIDYLDQIFWGSVETLATGPERLQERLLRVLDYLAARMENAVEGVSPEVAERYRQLLQRGSRVEAKGDEGRIAATCHAMDDGEAVAIAKEIVSICQTVRDLKLERRS